MHVGEAAVGGPPRQVRQPRKRQPGRGRHHPGAPVQPGAQDQPGPLPPIQLHPDRPPAQLLPLRHPRQHHRGHVDPHPELLTDPPQGTAVPDRQMDHAGVRPPPPGGVCRGRHRRPPPPPQRSVAPGHGTPDGCLKSCERSERAPKVRPSTPPEGDLPAGTLPRWLPLPAPGGAWRWRGSSAAVAWLCPVCNPDVPGGGGCRRSRPARRGGPPPGGPHAPRYLLS
jgi:hypothetical protein